LALPNEFELLKLGELPYLEVLPYPEEPPRVGELPYLEVLPYPEEPPSPLREGLSQN